jgi:hypothetical protein
VAARTCPYAESSLAHSTTAALISGAVRFLNGGWSKQTCFDSQWFLNWRAVFQNEYARARAYAMGIVDGMLLAPLFNAPKQDLSWFANCVEGMKDTQVVGILTKDLRGRFAGFLDT